TALIVVGWCVTLTNRQLDWQALPADSDVDYSVIWAIASLASLLGIAILATTRDVRHESRTHSARLSPP
ncbi:MAG: hypothetical protein KF861_14290, partial [Planctomycetaceae bacterium]|nr:hypothetical protein [Planctomycetaceae bacterium]